MHENYPDMTMEQDGCPHCCISTLIPMKGYMDPRQDAFDEKVVILETLT